MAHTIAQKTKLLHRVRRIRGQMEAVERALDTEVGCAEVLRLIAAARGAINGLMAEVMEDHIRMHVVDPAREPDPERAKGAEELIDVVHSYLKYPWNLSLASYTDPFTAPALVHPCVRHAGSAGAGPR